MGGKGSRDTIGYLDEALFPWHSNGDHQFQMLMSHLNEHQDKYKLRYYTLILSLQRNILPRVVQGMITDYYLRGCIREMREIYRFICTSGLFTRERRLDTWLISEYIEGYSDDNRKLCGKIRRLRANRYGRSTMKMVPIDPRPFKSYNVYKRPYTDNRHYQAISQRKFR